MSYKMQITEYTGELWQDERVHPDLLERLTGKDDLIEIVHGEPPFQVVIGVPHQAAVGVDEIAEEWWNPKRRKYGRPSDEAAALFALAAFSSLRDQDVPCKLIVAAHATDHDPNKELKSPYCQRVFAHPARLLFECHGARKGSRHALEATAGANELTDPKCFGRLLARALVWQYQVAAQNHPGVTAATLFADEQTEKPGKLRLSGLDTDSLQQAADEQMHALHLEATPRFRIAEGKTNTLTEDGKVLGEAIATAIMGYLDII